MTPSIHSGEPTDRLSVHGAGIKPRRILRIDRGAVGGLVALNGPPSAVFAVNDRIGESPSLRGCFGARS